MLVVFVVTLIVVLVFYALYFVKFMRWQTDKTRGDAFFSLTLEDRRALKGRIKRHAPFVLPVFKIISLLSPLKYPPLFRYKNVSGPAGIASKKSFQAAEEFIAGGDDIFIATQMKCGTTWMQQIVFEILHKGRGDLTDKGYRHMYALSPWIETSPRGSVPLERAPYVSDYKKRIIKTHMPAALCPYSKEAKYIYVTRHPVSCYASAVDFFEFLLGPLAPDRKNILNFFCSDNFFWNNWAKNVEGWWQWSQQYNNVLFIHFEDLKANPKELIEKISAFLDVALTEQEIATVVSKCSFQYMKEMEECFEMAPPSIFSMSSNTRFMQSGKAQRHKDVSQADRNTINHYMAGQLAESSYPLAEFYPDVIACSDKEN